MRLKTQKLLLNLAAGGLVLAGGTGFAALVMLPIGENGADTLIANGGSPSRPVNKETSLTAIDVRHPIWSRAWRQPLYDPPPPAPVVAAPRPITVKLMGTIIEPDNSQAFVQTASGNVELKRVGDPVTNDPADGTIAGIAATEITIKRDDGEHQLKVSQ